jgi:2-phosphosulfolactate phosphatase
MDTAMSFGQSEYDLRFDWGLDGMRAIAAHADALVIVDVLSFSTAVDMALSRGASVLPYRWNDHSADAFAREHGAILAQSRSAGGQYSLSPASLRSISSATRLVLPSPNGSTLALSAGPIPVYTACLRNGPSVARRAASHGRRVAVVAAGEHWRESSVRPCLEDLIGAGSVLAELSGTSSPEAQMAVTAFAHFRSDLADALLRCGSGKELVERGFAPDVELAAEYAISPVAPVLINCEFVDAAA